MWPNCLRGFLLVVVFFSVTPPSALRARQTGLSGIDTLTVHWKTHDLRRKDNGSYLIIGPDPYLYPRERIEYSGDIQGFFFKLRLSGNSRRHSLQWYWATERHGFAEKYSFHSILQGKGKEFMVFLPLYFFNTREKITRIRLDMNPRTDRLVSILSFGLVRHVEAWLLDSIPKGTGFVRIDDPAVFQSRIIGKRVNSTVEISTSWIPHDMKRINKNTFRIIGDDPYLESPILALDPHGVRGIYLELAGDARQASCRMQFFWKTYLMDYPVEKKSYGEGESYWFWLKIKDHVARFYLPFDPVNPDDILKRIRLDFAPCKNMVFRIQQAKLIGRQVKEYRRFLPTQAVFHTMAAIPERHGNELTVPWRQLLFWDRGFWIVFGVMIFTVISTMILFLVCHLRNGRRNYGWRELPPRYQRYGKTEE